MESGTVKSVEQDCLCILHVCECVSDVRLQVSLVWGTLYETELTMIMYFTMHVKSCIKIILQSFFYPSSPYISLFTVS